MKRIVSLALFVSSLALMSSSPSFASQPDNFMPDNDLWKEDNLFFAPNVTQEMFNRIIDAGLAAYQPLARANNESLVVNRNWNDSTVNANAMRSWGNVTINMYGGLARRPEVIPEGFALVLCHELGHAYGGEPYLRPSTKMAAEGQADYYGSKKCLTEVFKQIPVENFNPMDVGAFGEGKCADTFGRDSQDYVTCIRKLGAGYSLGKLLATLTKETIPEYDTPDQTVVRRTNLSYPDTTQCRLDTYFNGALNLDRPRCWFAPGR